MTCIVGLKDKGRVWIGGDSNINAGDTRIQTVNNEKVFKKGDFLFGVAGGLIAIQEILYRFNIPHFDSQKKPLDYMMTSFIPVLREKLREVLEPDDQFLILVGFKGELFTIDNSYSITTPLREYDCVGCGEDIAKGSLFSTPRLKPDKRVRLALKAAEEHTCLVREPFVVKFV